MVYLTKAKQNKIIGHYGKNWLIIPENWLIIFDAGKIQETTVFPCLFFRTGSTYHHKMHEGGEQVSLKSYLFYNFEKERMNRHL